MPLDLPSLATADLAKYIKMPSMKISFVGELSQVTYKKGIAMLEVSMSPRRVSATVQVRHKDGWRVGGGGPSVMAYMYGSEFLGEATYSTEDRAPSQLDVSVVPPTQEQLETAGEGGDRESFTPDEVTAEKELC